MTAASLDALRDIHLPPAPALSWLPEWGIAALVLLAALGFWTVHRLLRRRALRVALRELAQLAAAHARDGDGTLLARGLSRLLRRHAVACFPQAGVEGLSGAAWLQFLDAHGGAGAFCVGAGAVLASRPYQSHGDIDAAALIGLVRQWLEANPR